MTPSATLKHPTFAVFLAVTVVFVAFFLRVWHLADPSFWWDEAYSTMVASGGLGSIVSTLAREDFHPPLHYVVLHFWMKLAGKSEFSLRFVSVAAGVLTVAASWIAAKRLLMPSAAPIAAIIFTLSPYLWYYSQEARMFALVPLFGVLALYFCARAVEEKARWVWIAYLTTIALGLWDFYYAIFLPFVCGFWIVIQPARRRTAFPPWAISTLIAFVLYAPWIPIWLGRSGVWASAFIPENGPAKVVVWTWPELLLGLPNLALYQYAATALLLGLGAVIAVAALGYAWFIRRQRPGTLLAALAFVVPFLTIAAINAVKPVYHPRYAIPVAAGLYLALAALLDYLFHAKPAVATRLAALAVSIVLLVAAGFGMDHLKYDPAYARDDYRDAIAYVQHAEQPGDAIIHNAIPPVWYYYHGSAPTAYFPAGPYTDANVADGLNQIARGRTRLWYVWHAAIPNDPDGFVDTQLRLHSQRLDERWFGAIRVQLWQLSTSQAFAVASFTPVSQNVANQLTLTGYAVSGEPIGGHSIDVELRWQVSHTPSADDGFWVGLADSNGRSWGRADARPRDAGYRLSSGWPAGETVITRFDLPVAIGTPPGAYHLVAGVYRLSDLAGLNVLDADQHPIGQAITLGPSIVKQPSVGKTDPSLANQIDVSVTPTLVLAADQIGATAAVPGDRVPVTLLWRSNGPMLNARANLRLEASDGKVIVEDDRSIGDFFPTERWIAGQLVREQRSLSLPASAPSGTASLKLVLADGRTIQLGSLAIARVVRDFNLPSTPHPMQAVLGDSIALVGYDLSGDRLRAGDQLAVTLDWHALRPSSTSYHVFVHLLDEKNHIWAQWDGVPKNWTYPTSAWVPGEYVADRYPLTLSPDAPAGRFVVEVGLYDAVTGKRLTVESSSGAPTADRIVLQSIQVEPQ